MKVTALCDAEAVTSFDRRSLLLGMAGSLGVSLATPIERALADGAVPGFAASHSIFTPPQRTLIGAVCDRIIPATDTPGAVAAGVQDFIEMMVADWYEPADSASLMKGFGVLDGFAHTQHGKLFADLPGDQQDSVLTCAMRSMMPGLPGGFFEHCRQLVMLGYYSSEIGCRQERVYLPIPGRYDGAYRYDAVNRVFSG